MEAELNGHRILVVDDEPLILMDTIDVLNAAGAVVEGASSVAQAVRMLNQHRFSLVLVDWVLGDETAARLLALLVKRGMPVAIYSAAELTLRPRNFELLSKPMPPCQLVAEISSLLGRPSLASLGTRMTENQTSSVSWEKGLLNHPH